MHRARQDMMSTVWKRKQKNDIEQFWPNSYKSLKAEMEKKCHAEVRIKRKWEFRITELRKIKKFGLRGGKVSRSSTLHMTTISYCCLPVMRPKSPQNLHFHWKKSCFTMTNGGLRGGHKNSQTGWTMEKIHVTSHTFTGGTGTTFFFFSHTAEAVWEKPTVRNTGDLASIFLTPRRVDLATSLTHQPPCLLLSPKASPLVQLLEM